MFPGKAQTEEDISRFEKMYGRINALAMDSQFGLEGLKDYSARSRFESESAFPAWGMLFASDRNIPLIAADPVNLVPVILSSVEKEEEGYQNLFTERYRNVVDQGQLNVDESFWVQKLAALGFAASGGLYALKNTHTRRRFLTGGAGAVAGAVFLNGLGKENGESNNLSNLSDEQIHELAEQDFKMVTGDVNSVGPIPQYTLDSEQFSRRAKYDSEYFKYLLVLRNALIAEVLSQPTSDLVGYETHKPINVAVVMGYSHLVVPERFRISYLVKDKEARHSAIRGMLKQMVDLLKKEGTPREEVLDSLDMIKNYPRRYEVSERNIEIKSISVPTLGKIVDDLTKQVA